MFMMQTFQSGFRCDHFSHATPSPPPDCDEPQFRRRDLQKKAMNRRWRLTHHYQKTGSDHDILEYRGLTLMALT